jgi:serine/threonine-protein kinase
VGGCGEAFIVRAYRPVDSTRPIEESAQLPPAGADVQIVSSMQRSPIELVVPVVTPPIDRYELLERIGRGAVGDVHRAREHVEGFVREVCIKRLVAAVAEEQAACLREEARVLAGVRHANVVSLLGAGEEPNGTPFLVLELIRGVNLRTLCLGMVATSQPAPRCATGFVPDMVAIHVACGVLRALAAVQRALPGLVHRDVTPHNVLVSNEGEVKLGDFGIALAIDRVRWTAPNIVKGKLGYVSPEYFRGEELDVRSDLFSVGVTLYELLTRRRPWGNASGMQEVRAIQRGAMVPVCVHRPRIEPAVADIVERLLAHRRDERFACADDALRALAPFSAGDLGSLRLAALVAALAAPSMESR